MWQRGRQQTIAKVTSEKGDHRTEHAHNRQSSEFGREEHLGSKHPYRRLIFGQRREREYLTFWSREGLRGLLDA